MTLEEAYVCLGVNEHDSMEEIKVMYECLMKYYAKEMHQDETVKMQIRLWKEAYETILLNDTMRSLYTEQHKIRYHHKLKQEDSNETTPQKKSFRFYVGRLLIILLIMILSIQVLVNLQYAVDELKWLIDRDETMTMDGDQIIIGNLSEFDKGYEVGLFDGLENLRNDFSLEISKFNDSINWDWAYYENTEFDWYVIIPIKVKETQHLGALLNLYSFKLDGDYPTPFLVDDIALDADLKKVHFLGQYEELIPKKELIGIVFHVSAFSSLEERILYYEYPNGRVIEVGRIKFNDTQNSKPAINFNIVDGAFHHQLLS